VIIPERMGFGHLDRLGQSASELVQAAQQSVKPLVLTPNVETKPSGFFTDVENFIKSVTPVITPAIDKVQAYVKQRELSKEKDKVYTQQTVVMRDETPIYVTSWKDYLPYVAVAGGLAILAAAFLVKKKG